METVYSLAHEEPDASGVVWDFMAGEEAAGWFVHRFDADGGYLSVARSDVEEIRDVVGGESPTGFVVELRAAASALEAAVSSLLEVAESAALAGELEVADRLAGRAGEVERERLAALDEVIGACDAEWDQALERVERARRNDPQALTGALRTVELLWTAKQAVRRALRPRRP